MLMLSSQIRNSPCSVGPNTVSTPAASRAAPPQTIQSRDRRGSADSADSSPFAATPPGPRDKDGLKRQPQPKRERQEIEAGHPALQRHVHIRGKDGHEQGDESPAR